MQGTEFEASLPFILFGAAGVLVLVVVGWIVRGGFADRRWWKELEEQGVDGTAVVLDVADVSEPHSRTELAFTLRVSLPGMLAIPFLNSGAGYAIGHDTEAAHEGR